MPRSLFTLLLCVLSLSAFAQVVAIQNEREHTLYTCTDNRIIVAVSNIRPSKIIVTTDNGTITNSSTPGHYFFITRKAGNATIYVNKKTHLGLKLVDSVHFWVRKLPPPHITLNGKTKGLFPKPLICAVICPTAIFNENSFAICAKLPMKEFTVFVYRNTKQIFTRKLHDEYSTRIDSITNDFFTTLENGDSVVFNNFIVADCSGERTDVNSLEFTITEAENYRKPPPHKPGDIEEIIDPITGESHIKKW